jgi:hypothetical protein
MSSPLRRLCRPTSRLDPILFAVPTPAHQSVKRSRPEPGLPNSVGVSQYCDIVHLSEGARASRLGRAYACFASCADIRDRTGYFHQQCPTCRADNFAGGVSTGCRANQTRQR